MSRFRRARVSVGLSAACVALTLGMSTSAVAVEPPPEGDSILAAIADVAPDVLNAAATTTETTEDAALYYTDADVSVTVPAALDKAAVLTAGERELTVSLPFADTSQSPEATLLGGGVTAFDNGNASVTAPVVRDDGSLQILTVIEGTDAPTRFEYNFSVPEGGAMTVREDGVVLITDAAGDFTGGVAPAWARDASGDAVPTHYEVSGHTLTQVVDHGADTHYPVVADPWAGIQLFQSFKRDRYNGDYRYSAWATPLGAVVLSGGGGVGGYAAGQVVFRGAGWNEWKARWPAITNKATLQQQYNCHVAAGTLGLPFTKDYNLERFRSNRSNWVSGVASHRCNW